MAKSFGQKEIAALLEEGRVGLKNARNTPLFLERFRLLNYGEGKLDEGLALCGQLEDQQALQQRLMDEGKSLTLAFRAAWTAVKKLYTKHSQIASAILAERPDLLAVLGLDGPRMKAFGEWMVQAQQFYREAQGHGEIMALLTAEGLPTAVLQAGQAQLTAVLKADEAQEQNKGFAQQATQNRDALAAEFKQWMKNFWKIADVALAGNPQWQESLGRNIKS